MASVAIGDRLTIGRPVMRRLRRFSLTDLAQDLYLLRSRDPEGRRVLALHSLRMGYTRAENPIALFRHNDDGRRYINRYQRTGDFGAILAGVRAGAIFNVIFTHNARTNTGGIQQASRMGNASATPANRMCLVGNATVLPTSAATPNVPDSTTLSTTFSASGGSTAGAELTGTGIARQAATYTAPTITGGTSSSQTGVYQLAATFTNGTGATRYVNGMAVWDNEATPNVWFEAGVTPTQLNANDSLTLTYQVTI